MIIISAQSSNGMIGGGGRLPWDVPEEYQHFLDSVAGHVMVMGRKSFDVFGADVATKLNVVLSRSESCIEGAKVLKSFTELKELEQQMDERFFIAGGGQVYASALACDVVSEIWLSTLPFAVEGDVAFPAFDRHKFHLADSEDRGLYLFERWVKAL